MAIKSIKVKLRLGDMPEIKNGLWKLHSEVNSGVRYYSEWLSLLRQESLYRRNPEDENKQECYKTSQECKEELLKRLRNRQQENQHHGSIGSNEELLQLARQLYELLIPQSVGAKGDAQQISRKFLSPLVDPDAVGGLGIAKAGNKPRWVRMRDSGTPGWEEEKNKDVERKLADPTSSILRSLESFGLKPLMQVYTESEMSFVQWKSLRVGQAVRTWDRDMFQQAIERMMSWESWNKKVGEEHAKLIEQRDRFMQKNFVGQEHLVDLINHLEEEMKDTSQGFESKALTAHFITNRALRGAEQVFEKWRNFPIEEPFEAFDKIIKNIQSKNTRRFGSYDLFAKLAEPKYQQLWREDLSFVIRYAKYNIILKKLKNAKLFATFTLPNPTGHPIWTRFDKLGGNLQQYIFLFNWFGPDKHAIRFQKLVVVEDNLAKEVDEVIVPVASSTQLNKLIPTDVKDSTSFLLSDPGSDDPFRGEFAGAKLQYHRVNLDRLEKHRRINSTSAAGDVYLNMSLRIQSQSDARSERRPPYAALFNIVGDNARVYVNYDKLLSYIEEHPDEGITGSKGLRSGLRVMSVDLGLRTSASISVFRIAKKEGLHMDSKGRSPLFYPVFGVEDLVAIHERSQLLKMPGETETKELRKIRETRLKSLNQLKSQLSYLRLLVKCTSEDVKRRERSWLRLIDDSHKGMERMTSDWRSAFETELKKLELMYGSCTSEDWVNTVHNSIHVLWRHMGIQVRDWKKEVRSSDKVKIRGYARDVVGGNSIAQIEYLERQYKFLKSWSFFGKISGQVIRAERGSHFAVALREHIDHAKEDRLKKLSDRVIMEALGYVYQFSGRQKGEWVAKYPPCQLILLEELSEYRFNNDRPPSENNQLMKWGHRGVFEELKNQAGMHDLLIGTMFPAFSSRFDARFGTPGIRCRRVSASSLREDVQENLPWWLKRFISEYKLERSLLRPDDLIPTGEGEFFVSPLSLEDGDLRQIHADINAAQNLQRRLWSNFDISEIRLRCIRSEADGELVLIPKVTSKRAIALYKNKVFKTNNEKTFYERDKEKKRGNVIQKEDITEDEMELLLEADEAREQSVVLLRDPSGIINYGNWTIQHVFWNLVNDRTKEYLVNLIRSRENEQIFEMQNQS